MKIIIAIILVSFNLTAFAEVTDDHKHGDVQAHKHNQSSISPIGQPAESSDATKTINVETLDIMKFAFSPALDIQSGDIVQFIVVNTGKVRHEFSIGDAEEQKAHAQMMMNMEAMVHEDGNTITVEARETKEITWQFTGNEIVMFACNIPGHFEAGMHESVAL